MKNLKYIIILCLFLGIVAYNFSVMSNVKTGSDISLYEILKINNANASEVNPNTHSGHIKDFNKNCCKKRYHDDECTGKLC